MVDQPPFTIEFDELVVGHLRSIEAKYHSLVEAAIEDQLRHTADIATRNRKPLNQIPGPFDSSWEIRFGPKNQMRLFYDVDSIARVVHVKAIGIKIRNRLFIGGEEYEP